MKLRNKLILSCAALAAVATTAVSTTFAWYTSNQEVTADSIYASTSSNSDALLLISKTGAANSWSSKVSLDLDAKFVPVYRDANGAMHTWAPDTNTTNSGAAPTSAYLQFSLYFKSGNGNRLNVAYKNFDLLNTTTLVNSSLPTKSVLTNQGLPTGATSNGTYTVDLLKAITMENVVGLAAEGEANTSSQAFTTQTANLKKPTYKFEGLSKVTDTVADNDVNAHTYYNDVKTLDYKRADTYSATATYYTKSADTYTLVDKDGDAEFSSTAKYVTYADNTYTAATVTAANFATFKAAGNLYTYVAGTYSPATVANQDALDAGIFYEVAAIATTYDGSVQYRTQAEEDARTNVTAVGNLNSDDALATFVIGGDNNDILRVDYFIYLDGWDFHCFDACQSQNISLSMMFQSSAAA